MTESECTRKRKKMSVVSNTEYTSFYSNLMPQSIKLGHFSQLFCRCDTKYHSVTSFVLPIPVEELKELQTNFLEEQMRNTKLQNRKSPFEVYFDDIHELEMEEDAGIDDVILVERTSGRWSIDWIPENYAA